MKRTTDRPHLWLFAVLALVGLVADQASKYGVFTYLYAERYDPFDPPHITLIPDAFRVEAIHTPTRDPGEQPLSFLRTISGPCLPRVNRGALFGLGNGPEDGDGMNHLFALISVGAAGFILVWAARPMVAQDRLLSMALGLILGGALGNLYDRIVFGGVRDFLHWYYWYDWPVFNIADCCLVCGAAALLLHSFFVHDKIAEPARTMADKDMPTTTSVVNGG